ncbi:MAG TPA: DUF1737 domain-containing protein [Pyrinomonadaceae bacterium]|jgi:hypothetical protein
MEYTIVEGAAAEEVIATVNKLLSEGWELHGSLAISGVANSEEGRVNNLYAQAMTKKTPEQWSAA